MMEWLKHFFRFEPPERGQLELLLMRLALAVVIFTGFFGDVYHEEQRVPNGLATYFDLTAFINPEVFPTLKYVFAGASVLYVVGFLPVLSAGYMAFLMVCVGTLRNSQGNIHHGTQLITMVVLVQFGAYVWDVWQRRRGGDWKRGFVLASRGAHQRGVQLGLQASVAGYVVAAICKLEASGLRWIWDVPLLSTQVMKIGYQRHFDYLDGAVLAHAEKMASLIVENPNLSRVLIGGGLVLELMAFFALFNRGLAFWVGFSLWVMHLMVTTIMQLSFALNEWILVMLFINLPFMVVYVLRRSGLYDDRPVGAGKSPGVALRPTPR